MDCLSLSQISKKDFHKIFIESASRPSVGGRMQARDYQIMRFILEQKFCSLEAIYFRFFDTRSAPTETPPKNLWTTRQRLSKLRKLLLIRTEKIPSSGKAHFLLTPVGWKVLTNFEKAIILIKPAKSIDFSLYEHDVRITMIRALTEAKGKCSLWYSEKWLKAESILIGGKFKFHFAKDLRPDAFFINSKAERVALELEVSRKAKSRIEDKIRLYDDLIEESYRSGFQEGFKVLDKVWFVATKPVVVRFLKKMIEEKSRHPLCYRVDFYDQIISGITHG